MSSGGGRLDRFESERPHLFSIAYRMLGSASAAEDVLQEASLRWSREEREVDSTRAFLTTTVVRLCLDELKSARARRETYVGPWLPEPLLERAALTTNGAPPADARAELVESLSIAFLALLERLSPLERAAFLLREVFDHDYGEVARVLETSEAACRQLVRRARAHIEANRPRFVADDAKKQELLLAFLTACSSGDPTAFGRILANDVVLRTDGGGKIRAALKPVRGVDHVTRFLLGVMKKFPPTKPPEVVRINGEPGIVFDNQGTTSALTLSVDGDAITAIWLIGNPEKMTHALDRLEPRDPIDTASDAE